MCKHYCQLFHASVIVNCFVQVLLSIVLCKCYCQLFLPFCHYQLLCKCCRLFCTSVIDNLCKCYCQLFLQVSLPIVYVFFFIVNYCASVANCFMPFVCVWRLRALCVCMTHAVKAGILCVFIYLIYLTLPLVCDSIYSCCVAIVAGICVVIQLLHSNIHVYILR